MAVSPEDEAAAALAREAFDGLGRISVRRMFGGAGIYCEGLFFALISEGDIYLKADAAFADTLCRQGAVQFSWTNKAGRVTRMGFWRLPDAAVDDFELALDWGRQALAVAKAARRAKSLT